MRRLTLLLAGGAVWLFLAAVPVLADGGPHIASLNSGTTGINADSCAACHRTHTAQASYLLIEEQPAMCITCQNRSIRVTPSNQTWKNNMQVVHTAGVPPNQGKIILPITGWTWKTRKALKKMAIALVIANATPVWRFNGLMSDPDRARCLDI